MQTLSNNIKKPEDGDTGNVWSDGLEYNAEALNDLITTVANLDITNISRSTQLITNANWVVDANGKGYKQIVLMPGSVSFANSVPSFRVTNGPKTNRLIHPSINPLSLTSYEIIVNDSTLDLEILYL